MRVDRIEGHSFLAPLSPRATVVDLGANRGRFAAGVRDRYGASVYAVEPVPELAASLPDDLPVLQAAAGSRSTLYLRPGSDASAFVGADDDPQTIAVEALTLGEILARFDLSEVRLLKVDIEGAELDVLREPEIDRCRQVTVEFHDFLAPSMAATVKVVCTSMRARGFTMLRFSRDNTDVLFVRGGLALPVRAWLLLRFKYLRGFRRVIARIAR